MPKARIAVVSPFVDRRHGTERCLAEQLERLKRDYEIHLFSGRVEDVDLEGIAWHRVPEMPGPHLLKFLFWFEANRVCRWMAERRSGRPFDLVYSPGINCPDADVVLVHHLFTEQLARVGGELRFLHNRPDAWPRILHRRLYYGLLERLERRIYPRQNLSLATISRSMSADLERSYRRQEAIPVIRHGVDSKTFRPDRRLERREEARVHLGFHSEDVIALLVGNDWAKKGLPCLIDSLVELRGMPVRALVVGNDSQEPYVRRAEALGIADRLVFAPVSPDVMEYYAAADLYVAPSIYDPFGLPALEAMACGLPVIASSAMGASELMEDGQTGLVLRDPRDSGQLARLIGRLASDPVLRARMGLQAAESAGRFTWDANAEGIRDLWEKALAHG